MTENQPAQPAQPAQLSREPRLLWIDPGSRYILLLRFAAGASQQDMTDTVQRTGRLLADWWDSQSPYLVLGHTERLAIVLGRLTGAAASSLRPEIPGVTEVQVPESPGVPEDRVDLEVAAATGDSPQAPESGVPEGYSIGGL